MGFLKEVYLARFCDKANLLGEAFSKVFTIDDGRLPVVSAYKPTIPSPGVYEIFNRDKLCRYIETWKSSSCKTPDNLNLGFIKKLAVPMSVPLEQIFVRSFENNEVPCR